MTTTPPLLLARVGAAGCLATGCLCSGAGTVRRNAYPNARKEMLWRV